MALDEIVQVVLLAEVREHNQHILQLLVLANRPCFLKFLYLLIDLVKLLFESRGHAELLGSHFFSTEFERNHHNGGSISSGQVAENYFLLG